jgi:hypothetical protein
MFVLGAASVVCPGTVFAAEEPVIIVHRDPDCGCCGGWVEHLQKAGFRTNVLATKDLDAVKRKLGVPDELAACHTAEVSGYVIEGHVPAAALKRLLAEKLNATGLAVPGMPIGSPGMVGGNPEQYEVILFGPGVRRSYMRFIGEKVLG